MDILQIALIALIFLLAAMLSLLGLQVFFILKDLRKSLEKFDLVLKHAAEITGDLEQPIHTAAEITQAVKVLAKSASNKRLFKKS